MMNYFRKKPIVIEAMQFNDDRTSYELLHWINTAQHEAGKEFARWHNANLFIPTLEGNMAASKGDWIIRGVAGEFYPCKPDIFEATYERVDTPPPAQEATSDVLWPDERIQKALGIVSDAQIDYAESFIVPLVMALHACQAIRDDYQAELDRRAPVQEATSDVLRPCPWCGSAPYIREVYGQFEIDCSDDNDDCPSEVHISRRTKEEAAAAWNRRAPVPTMPCPDWANAPDWATWWAVDAYGSAYWYNCTVVPHGASWVRNSPMSDTYWQEDRRVDLPIGVDWRATLVQREAGQGRLSNGDES